MFNLLQFGPTYQVCGGKNLSIKLHERVLDLTWHKKINMILRVFMSCQGCFIKTIKSDTNHNDFSPKPVNA